MLQPYMEVVHSESQEVQTPEPKERSHPHLCSSNIIIWMPKFVHKKREKKKMPSSKSVSGK